MRHSKPKIDKQMPESLIGIEAEIAADVRSEVRRKAFANNGFITVLVGNVITKIYKSGYTRKVSVLATTESNTTIPDFFEIK